MRKVASKMSTNFLWLLCNFNGWREGDGIDRMFLDKLVEELFGRGEVPLARLLELHGPTPKL